AVCGVIAAFGVHCGGAALGVPIALRANSVATRPGITIDTSTPFAATSARRFIVSAFSAAFAALYAERCAAIGTRARNDEMLIRCPPPRSTKYGTMACIP